MCLAGALPQFMVGKRVAPFVFTDQGSLVSLAEYSSAGNLMGKPTTGSFFIVEQLAKIMCWALH